MSQEPDKGVSPPPADNSPNQQQQLEQEIKIFQDWKILKTALKEKYQVHPDAFNALKKPDADSLTKQDFSAYTSINIDAIFKQAGSENLAKDLFQKMWETWEFNLQEDQHKLSIISEKAELKNMLSNEQEKKPAYNSQSSADDEKQKKKLLSQDSSNLEQLSTKLDTMLTLTQKTAKAKEPNKISGDCFQDLLHQKSEPKAQIELAISKFKIVEENKDTSETKNEGQEGAVGNQAENKEDSESKEPKDQNKVDEKNKDEKKDDKKDEKKTVKSMLDKPSVPAPAQSSATNKQQQSPIKKSYIDTASSYIKKPSPVPQFQKGFLIDQLKASPVSFFSSPGNPQVQPQQYEEEEETRNRFSTRKNRIKESFEGYLSELFVNPNPVKFFSPQKSLRRSQSNLYMNSLYFKDNNLDYIKNHFFLKEKNQVQCLITNMEEAVIQIPPFYLGVESNMEILKQ